MTPASLVLTVAAGLAGTVLLAIPAVRPAPAAVTSQSVTVRPSAGVRAAVPGSPVLVQASAVPLARSPAAAARFRWPLSPAPSVLRRFAVGPQPWSPGHRGVDLGAVAGQHVLAAGSGTVAFAGVVAGRGVVAVGHSGGLRTTYEPVTAKVRAGDAVAAGAPLGVLAIGSHCATACLHWGALRGDVYIDPLSLLGPAAPPVLLPLGTG